jgi:hypothetical protein
MAVISRDFVTKNGIVIEGDSAVTSSTNQVDALQAAGGVAIAKNLIVGTTATIFGDTTLKNSLTVSGQTNFGGPVIPTTAGINLGSLANPFKDLYLNGNSLYVGNVVLSVTGTTAIFGSNLGSVKLIAGSAKLLDSTNSTSTTTGALVVNGGIGIAKDLYVGTNLNVVNTSTLQGPATLLSTLTVQGQSLFNDTTSATSAGAGSVKITGGLRVNDNAVIMSAAANTGTLESNALYIEGGVGIKNGLAVSGTAVFKNDVYFQGATTYVYSTNTIYTDNILDLHVPMTGIDGTWLADDGKDIGFRFNYYNSGADKNALLLLSNDSKKLEFFSDATEVGGVLSNKIYGDFKTGSIQLTNTGTLSLSVAGSAAISKNLFVGGVLTTTNISIISSINPYGLVYQDPTGKLISQSNIVYNTSTQELVGTITRADNLTGGTIGSIPIQVNNGITTFIPAGNRGQLLIWDYITNTPIWGAVSDTATGFATTATSLLGGAAGNIVYQVGLGTTTFLANGTNGSILTFNTASLAPQWNAPNTLTVGYSNTATLALLATTATRALLADTATLALLANTATHALLADTATFALLADTATHALLADTATFALLADTATFALLADTATLALLANTATLALLANTATFALLADTATHALLADTATFALLADTATHALLADTATFALLADTATHALLADTATFALLADTATHALLADTATHALLADTATLALLANTATFALLADTATHALLADTATLALLANTATFALLADTATHALLADTATFALLADTATLALLANTATLALLANTATFALLADTATFALLADTATLALLANTATLALLANTATFALLADTATHALLADFATSSTYAYTATYAAFGGQSTVAINLANGTAGQIPYQSNTGTTEFFGPGIAGQLLISAGSTSTGPIFTNTSSIQVGYAANVLGGAAGSIVYQTNSDTTGMLPITSTAGSLLVSSGSIPQYVNQVQAIRNGIASYSTASGQSLIITAGGLGVNGDSYFSSNVGVGGTLYLTGDLYVDGTQFVVNSQTISSGDKTLTLSTSAASALLAASSGLQIGSTSTPYASFLYNGIDGWETGGAAGAGLKVTSTSSVNSANSGALQVGGGVGVAGNVFVVGDVTATTFFGNLTGVATTATLALSANTATLALNANTATNLAGGATGGIPVQTAPGVTSFVTIGTSTYILTSNGSSPEWTSLSNLSASNTAFADNIKNGAAGQLVYQISTSTTGFAGPGTEGQLLVSNGSSGPLYTNTSSIYVGRAVLADTATLALLANTATLALLANTATFALLADTATLALLANTATLALLANTATLALLANTATLALNANTATLALLANTATLALNANTATYATNVLGGSTGSIVYQSAANTTALLAGSATNSILTYINNAPAWSTTATLSDGVASSSTVNGQTLKVTSGGIGITGNSYFANNLGVGGAIYAATTSYIGSGTILTSVDLQTVTIPAIYITNDPTSQTGLSTLAGTSTSYGTYNFGSVTDIQTFNDYNTGTNTGFYSINDATGAPAFIVYIGFSGVTDFNRFVLNINYTQNSGHTQDIDLYNYQTSQWDTFTTYSGSTNWFQFILGIIDSTPYISLGKVTVRVYHVSSGNTAHRTWIDYAALENSIQGGQGPRGAIGATGATGPQGLTTSTTSTFTFFSTVSSTSTTADNAVYIKGGLGIDKSLLVTGEAVFINNVTFAGTTTYVLSTNTVYTDNIIELHYPTNTSSLWTVNDSKDIGLRFHFYDTDDHNAFLGRDNGTGYLEWLDNSNQDTVNNVTGTYGTFILGSIILTNTTASNSTTTGALTVVGGVGIGGALYVANTSYVAGAQIITTATVNQYASQTTIFAGTDTAVNTSTGAVTVWNTSTLQTVTGRGATTNNAISITNTTSSTSTSTGALTVVGGVGIGGTVTAPTFIGNLTGVATTATLAYSATTATNLASGTVGSLPYQSSTGTTAMLALSTSGYILTAGASAPQWTSIGGLTAGFATTATNLAGGTQGQVPYQTASGVTSFYGPGTAGNVLVSNGTSAPTYNNTLTLTGTATSISTTTGALQVRGGVGVADSVYVGNRVGFVGTTQASVVYQFYNTATNSLDTVFG